MQEPFIPRSQKLLQIIATSKPSLLPLFQKVHDGKAAILERVECMCLDCCGLDKTAVADCRDSCCSLHAIRPYQKSDAPTPQQNLSPEKDTQ